MYVIYVTSSQGLGWVPNAEDTAHLGPNTQ